MENDYWYVGQKVSEQRYGDGIITNIKSDEYYPITVKFENFPYLISYTEEGKLLRNDNFPLLSPYPHVPIKYNKIFKKGDLVKYKYQGNWYIGIYGGIEEGSHKVYEGFDDENMTKISSYNYIEDEDILKY